MGERQSLEEMHEKALLYARNRGFGDEAEDFAQWLVIKYLEKKSQHQALRYSFIDYIRESRGDSRAQSFAHSSKFEQFEEQYQLKSSHHFADELVYENEVIRILNEKLKPREKEIFALYYSEDITLMEVGQRLGLTESRCSQVMTAIRSMLEKILKKDE